MRFIEVVRLENWQDRERFWIAHHRSIGTNLTNLNDGGEGPEMTEEMRAKISKATKGKYQPSPSPEQRAAQSLLMKGRKKPPRTEEHLRKLAEKNKARASAATFKEQRQTLQKQLWENPTYRQRMIDAHKGKSHHVKKWIVTSPDGIVHFVENLADFARNNGMSYIGLSRTAHRAKANPSARTKDGWQCILTD